MRAVVYSEYGVIPLVGQVPEPVCPDGGVVLAVGATGVCRSDWHAWKGHDPVPLPHIPGHELAGVVGTVGRGVVRWRVGDRVTVPFVCGCGACDYCRAGEAQVCPDQTQPGFTGPGSFAERVAIHAADVNLVALPDAVDFVAAALGARVVAVDVAAATLDRARELGAEAVVDARAVVDPAAAIRDITGGGAQVSVDALGSAETVTASVRCLRRRGRHVQVGLLFGAASTPPIPMDLVISHELEIYGTHGMAAHEYPPMLAMVADGTLRPDQLISEVIGLEDAPTALATMDRPASSAGITVIQLHP